MYNILVCKYLYNLIHITCNYIYTQWNTHISYQDTMLISHFQNCQAPLWSRRSAKYSWAATHLAPGSSSKPHENSRGNPKLANFADHPKCFVFCFICNFGSFVIPLVPLLEKILESRQDNFIDVPNEWFVSWYPPRNHCIRNVFPHFMMVLPC